MNKARNSTLWLTYTGVLIALQIVLGNFVQVALLEKQMNLGFLPIAAAGYLFGPVSAMIVAALGDILGTLILGTGAYFPGFTVTALIVGCVYGLFMYPRYQKWLTAALKNHVADIAVRALIAAILAAAAYIFINSYWVTFIVPKGYLVLLLGRLPFNLAEIPIFTVLITVTCIALDRLPGNVLPTGAVHGKPADADQSAKP